MLCKSSQVVARLTLEQEKQAKRERKLAEKKAKRLAKEGPKKDDNKDKALDASKPITLDFLTNPNKE